MTLGVAYSASVGQVPAGRRQRRQRRSTLRRCSTWRWDRCSRRRPRPPPSRRRRPLSPGIALPFSNFVGTIGQMLRPYPQYGAISAPWFDLGQSNYQGRRLTLNRRFASGFTFSVGYTFSKELDNLLASTRNPFDYSLEKSRGASTTGTSSPPPRVRTAVRRRTSLNPGNAVARAIVSRWTVIRNRLPSPAARPWRSPATACNAGGILGTCIPNYNPEFNGNVRINGNYGDGNVLGSSPDLVPGPDRVRRSRGLYRGQPAEDRCLRPQCAIQLIDVDLEPAPRVRAPRKDQARHPGRRLQREQCGSLRRARD